MQDFHLLRRNAKPARNRRNRHLARNVNRDMRVLELPVTRFPPPGTVCDFIFFCIDIQVMPNPRPLLDTFVVKTGFDLLIGNQRCHSRLQRLPVILPVR